MTCMTKVTHIWKNAGNDKQKRESYDRKRNRAREATADLIQHITKQQQWKN